MPPRRFVLITAAACVLAAQPTRESADTFEAASIHPATEGAGRPGFQFTPGGGLRATHVTLNLLIQIAYDVPAERLSGGPKWAGSDEYDVIAKGPDRAPVASDATAQLLVRRRLQALLAERFHLMVRSEPAKIAGYDLVVVKQNSNLAESSPSESTAIRGTGIGRIVARATSMELLAKFLSAHAARPVVDKTGLSGQYDFTLEWSPDPEQLPPGAPVLSRPSLFTAVQEQLGLKLAPQKVETELITVVHAEKPSAN